MKRLITLAQCSVTPSKCFPYCALLFIKIKPDDFFFATFAFLKASLVDTFSSDHNSPTERLFSFRTISENASDIFSAYFSVFVVELITCTKQYFSNSNLVEEFSRYSLVVARPFSSVLSFFPRLLRSNEMPSLWVGKCTENIFCAFLSFKHVSVSQFSAYRSIFGGAAFKIISRSRISLGSHRLQQEIFCFFAISQEERKSCAKQFFLS